VGGALTVIASTPAAIWIASDGANVYFIDVHEQTLSRVPVGGGSPATVLLVLTSAGGLAIDETSVYCSDEGTGAIYRLNK
jgi:hypothetical protein